MKIYIVEDSALELQRLKRFVLEAVPGCEPECYTDSQDAMNSFLNSLNRPDIAFLDVQMPSPSGLELAKTFISVKPDINIIFTTAYSCYMKDAFDMFASGYVQKPFSITEIKSQLEHLRFPIDKPALKFHVQTFGTFDLFCDGKPVAFSSTRAKEALAYLIVHRGASVTKKELFATLFEDAEYTSSKQDYLKKIINSLKITLSEIGGDGILVHSRNCYSVDTSFFSCDLYEALDSNTIPDASTPYMEQYSWAEYRF